MGIVGLYDHKSIAESLTPRLGRGLTEKTISRLTSAGTITGASLLQPATAAPASTGNDYSFPDAPRAPSKPRDFA